MNKKTLHICHSLEKGGITSFVEELIKLNISTSTSHNILVWQKSPYIAWEYDYVDISKCSNKKQKFKNAIKEYDTIFVHSLMPFMLWSLFLRKKNVFLFQHGISFGKGKKKILKQLYYSVILNIFGFKVICSSNFAKQKLLNKVAVFKKKLLLIIPFGVNINQKDLNKQSQDGVLRIGFAGRVVEQKRVHKIINAIKLINDKIDLEFHIAGDGPLLNEIKSKSKEVANNRISFVYHGFLKDINVFYSQIDVFILPSFQESFGLVVLEALSRKIPAIVFADSGACVEFIKEGLNGYIVDSEEELSKKIEDLSAPSLGKELRLNMNNLSLEDYDISKTRFNLDAL